MPSSSFRLDGEGTKPASTCVAVPGQRKSVSAKQDPADARQSLTSRAKTDPGISQRNSADLVGMRSSWPSDPEWPRRISMAIPPGILDTSNRAEPAPLHSLLRGVHRAELVS